MLTIKQQVSLASQFRKEKKLNLVQELLDAHHLISEYSHRILVLESCMGKSSIRISKDGNQWCALIGEDLQSGIAGFGDTPSAAVFNLTKTDGFSEWSNDLV